MNGPWNPWEVGRASATLIDVGRSFPPSSPVVRKGLSYLLKTEIGDAVWFSSLYRKKKDRNAGAVWLAGQMGRKPGSERINLLTIFCLPWLFRYRRSWESWLAFYCTCDTPIRISGRSDHLFATGL